MQRSEAPSLCLLNNTFVTYLCSIDLPAAFYGFWKPNTLGRVLEKGNARDTPLVTPETPVAAENGNATDTSPQATSDTTEWNFRIIHSFSDGNSNLAS